MNIEVNYTRQADLTIEDMFFDNYQEMSELNGGVDLTVGESTEDENTWYILADAYSDIWGDFASVAYFSDYTLTCMACSLYGKYLQEQFPNLKVKVMDSEFNATVNSVIYGE